jgi:hypothetical protein
MPIQTIIAVRSSMPDEVGGDTDDAGVDGEYNSECVSRVVGGFMYAIEGFGGGKNTNLGGDGYR